MDSSGVVKSGLARRGHRLVYLVLIQSLVILWLASWSVGDYLNNVYVHQYVDSEIQAYGLIAALVSVLGSVGGGYAFIRRRHQLSNDSGQQVTSGSKSPISIPRGRPSLPAKTATSAKTGSPTPVPALSAPATKSIDSIIASVSPPAAEAGPKPGGELHPAVAAMKAELSERRVNLGLMSATMGQETSQAPAPRVETSPVSAPVQETSKDRPVLGASETPMLQRQPQPSPVPSPAQPSSFYSPAPPTPQPSTAARPVQPLQAPRPPPPPQQGVRPPVQQQGVRPMQPSPFGRLFQRPSLPAGQQPSGARPGSNVANERFEDAARKAGFQLAQSQSPPSTPTSQPAPSVPRNVTTVITGVMPVKKKDDDRSDQEKSNSQ